MKIGELVTLDEIKRNMGGFAKDKRPGANGWMVEFFDIIILELLVVVEESRAQGKIVAAMNDTFLALVPNNS